MNNITVDYYTLLDVAKNASAEDIKKSFRLLALRFHPDKNPNDIESEEKFKSISRAYETLSNPQKRMIYDRTGNADYSDMFSSSGGMQGRGGCAGKGGRCGRGRRGGGANFNVHDISLTRKEALEGAAIDIGIIKNGQREMHRVNLPEKIEDGTMLKYSDSSIGADFIIRVVYSD